MTRTIPDGWGSGPHPMNKLGRLRISTAIGYLAPAGRAPNLRIEGNTLTRRLIVEGGRVVAAEVERDGQVELVRGRLFVLSSGSLQSPGDSHALRHRPSRRTSRHGIDLVRETPGVGMNLCDHPALAVGGDSQGPVDLQPDQPIVQTIMRYTAPDSDQRNDLQIEAFSFSPRGRRAQRVRCRGCPGAGLRHGQANPCLS